MNVSRAIKGGDSARDFHMVSSSGSLNASLHFFVYRIQTFQGLWRSWGDLRSGRGGGLRGGLPFIGSALLHLFGPRLARRFQLSVLRSRCAAAPAWLPCTVNRQPRARQSVGSSSAVSSAAPAPLPPLENGNLHRRAPERRRRRRFWNGVGGVGKGGQGKG